MREQLTEFINLPRQHQDLNLTVTKLENSLTTIESDLEREKSISLDASLNEKRILEEKDELLKTDKLFGTTEIEINENLELSKENLNNLKKELEGLIFEIGKLVDIEEKIPKDINGRTPIHLAASRGHLEVINFFAPSPSTTICLARFKHNFFKVMQIFFYN